MHLVLSCLALVASVSAVSTHRPDAAAHGTRRGTSRATPAAAVEQLLAADRQFGAGNGDLVESLSAMFTTDVLMQGQGRFVGGIDSVRASLRANSANAGARATWAPLRAGISADGQHGFTFGYMTVQSRDGTRAPAKYMSYWVRRADGWRVAVYKRFRAPDTGAVSTPMAPALPSRLVAVSTDAVGIAAYRRSLDEAERAFSRDAQTIGLQGAFARYGSADAVNMGGPASAAYVVGADAISRAVGAGSPTNSSPVSWSPDTVLVASSGDLGITVGFIRQNAPAAGAPPGQGIPFFTIWRRASPREPWRYVAE